MTPRAPGTQLVSVAEAARITGCHPETIRRRIRVGELPHVRVGRAIRIHPADVTTTSTTPPREVALGLPGRPGGRR